METNVKDLLLDEDFINNKKAELEKDIVNIISNGNVLEFFSNYTYWNGIFAGLVINLASRFHLGLEFGQYEIDSPEEDFFQTRGHKVAGLIFAAAEDEYADENCKDEDVRIEHKSMAWFMLNKMYEFFGKEISERRVHSMMDEIMADTKLGYGLRTGVGQESQFLNLVRQLGFHIGSEKVASYEFGILAKKLKEMRPSLVSFMEGQTMVEGVNAFSWVEVHGPVEDAHANYALDAAQMIVDYIGTRDLDLQLQVIEKLQAGFNDFEHLQDKFFKKYIEISKLQNA